MVSLLLLMACRFGADRALPAGDAARPDVVLVSIDTLRADHLSAWGHDRPTSPFMDELAAGGTRFAHARSPSPWTLPAHSTLLTGQLPWTHRVVEDAFHLDPATPVLPAAMQSAGYRTGGFVSTLYVSRLFGFERGFHRFEDFGIHTEKANLSGELTFDRVVDEALSWWAEQPAGQPVFLFLHTYDVHYTYDPPEPFASAFDRPPKDDDVAYKNYFVHRDHPLTAEQMEHQRAQYDESIAWVDSQLRRLDERLRGAGRTVRWVVTADHGEEFGERGSWGHAHTLYAEQLHIPLIISERGPRGSTLPAGQVVSAPVGLHDIAPTVAAWAAGATPLSAEGIDLNPVMAGQAAPDRPFPAETGRFRTNRIGLYEGGLRLEWDLVSDRAELFEPATDPDEATDLAASRPGDVARLQARLLDLAGRPWVAHQDGTVLTSGSGRALLSGPRRNQLVSAGDRFQVLPLDAEVQFQVPGQGKLGPWAALGAPPPVGMPLSLDAGVGGPAGVHLDEQTRQALEALGYVQGEE